MSTRPPIVILGAGLAGASAAETLRTEGYDGRVVLASLTTKGAQLVESATHDLNEQVFTSPGLTEAEVRQATALLSSLRAAHGDDVD